MAENIASSPAALRSQGSAQAQDKSSTRRDQGKDSAKWDMGVSINGGVSLNGWFISWKILFKMDDLEVPSFQETSI